MEIPESTIGNSAHKEWCSVIRDSLGGNGSVVVARSENNQAVAVRARRRVWFPGEAIASLTRSTKLQGRSPILRPQSSRQASDIHVFTNQKLERPKRNSESRTRVSTCSLPLFPTIRAEPSLTQRSVHNLHRLNDLLVFPPLSNQLYPHRQSLHRIGIVSPPRSVKRLVHFCRRRGAAAGCREPVLGQRVELRIDTSNGYAPNGTVQEVIEQSSRSEG